MLPNFNLSRPTTWPTWPRSICDPPARLKELNPHLPGNIVQLVRRMMAKDPSRRPQTPDELTADLMRLEIETFSERGGWPFFNKKIQTWVAKASPAWR